VNGVTGLLEYVVSRVVSDSVEVTTETVITWQTEGTEQLPASVAYWEKGVEVFGIQFTQAGAGPTAADDTFVP